MDNAALKEAFVAFAVQGKSNAKGDAMDNKNFSKLCKDCGVINKSCTSTDVDIVFSKIKTKGARTITYQQFLNGLNELKPKRFRKEDPVEKMYGLVEGKSPGANKATKTSKSGGVDRMTDTSKYTGSHKERFDKDGKGKGIDGRDERVENTGYVGDYKGKDTYDSK